VLRKALDRLTASKVPVIGAILNGVDALYLEHK
jgi:Mrp family chromosome partitioning ATPase